MEAKRNGTDCPLRREGERRRERSLHIQAAHFLTNYCCKTSLSPPFPTGPSLSSLTLQCGFTTRTGQQPAPPATRVTEMTLQKATRTITESLTTRQQSKMRSSSDLDLIIWVDRGGEKDKPFSLTPQKLCHDAYINRLGFLFTPFIVFDSPVSERFGGRRSELKVRLHQNS